MGFCCKILSVWPYPESDQSTDKEPIVYNDNEPTRVQTCDDDTSIFPAKTTSRLGHVPVYRKSMGRKRVLVRLGYHSIQQMLSI